MSQSLTERYAEQIAGVLSCYDRLVICSATIRMSVSVNQDGACDRAWRA
jgi:hypothetical protein